MTPPPLREALEDRSKDAHALTVRWLPQSSCSGEWETCPSPYCLRDRAALNATPAPAPLDAVPLAQLDKAIRAHLEEWGEHQCGYDPCGRNIAKHARAAATDHEGFSPTQPGNTHWKRTPLARHDPSDHDCKGGVQGDKYPLDAMPTAEQLALYLHQARTSNDEPVYDMVEARRRAAIITSGIVCGEAMKLMKLHPNLQDYRRIVRRHIPIPLLADSIAEEVRQAHYRMEAVQLARLLFKKEWVVRSFLSAAPKWKGERAMDLFHQGRAEEVYGSLAGAANGDVV